MCRIIMRLSYCHRLTISKANSHREIVMKRLKETHRDSQPERFMNKGMKIFTEIFTL